MPLRNFHQSATLMYLGYYFFLQESMNQNLEVVLSVSQAHLREHRGQVQRDDPKGQGYESIIPASSTGMA